MSRRYYKITGESYYLEGLSAEEQVIIPHKKLAEELCNIDFNVFKATLKPALRKELEDKFSIIEHTIHFTVRENEEVEESLCRNMELILKLSETNLLGGNRVSGWSGIREFWRRCYRMEKDTTDVNTILNPLSRLCGYSNFDDFIHKNYTRPEAFKIVILPFWHNGINTTRSEEVLYKRFKTLQEKEGIKLDVVLHNDRTNKHMSFEIARNIGLQEGADLVVFGNLFLYREQKLHLCYTMVKSNPLIDYNKKKITYDFFHISELLEGTLPNDLDYLVYWTTGMLSYQNMQKVPEKRDERMEHAMQYFNKIVNELAMHDDEVYFRMGVIHELRGNIPAAIEYYTKALHCNRSHFSSMLNLGLLYAAKKEFETASNYLNQVLIQFNSEQHKLYEVGRTYMGITLKHLGEIELAIKNLTKAAEIINRNPALKEYKDILWLAYFELAELHYIAATEHGEDDANKRGAELLWKAVKAAEDIHQHKQIREFLVSTRKYILLIEIEIMFRKDKSKKDIADFYNEVIPESERKRYEERKKRTR